MKNIILIGLMGSGKTTVATALAKELQRPNVDLDLLLEAREKRSINQIFAQEGEKYFRDLETNLCQEVSMLDGHIISCGGGVILRQENMAYLQNNGLIFYIDRSVDDILQDVDSEVRPLIKDNPEKLYELHDCRHLAYLSACDYHIINDGSIADVVLKIKNIVK